MNANPIGLNDGPLTQAMRQPLKALDLLSWALVVLLAVVWFFYSYNYFEDDSFIHLEFARSLANGQGFSFGGHLTNGDTAPVWVLVLAAFHFVVGDWIIAAKVACAAGLVFALAGAWRLAMDLPRETAAHAWLPCAAVLLTATNPFVVHWSFSGMEAAAALGLTFWVTWAVFVSEPAPARMLFAAALLAVAPLLRPELMLFDAIVGPALLWRCNGYLRNHRPGSRLAVLGALVVFLALPLAIWCVYALHAFGSIIPNTNLAKRGGALPELAVRLAAVYVTGFPITLLLLPVALWQAFSRRRIPAAVWVLMLWPLACIAFYLLNHTLVQTRYCMLSMPSMTIGVLWVLGSNFRERVVTTAAAASLAVAIAVNALAGIPQVSNKKALRAVVSDISTYIRRQIPVDAPVAVLAIGQIGFESTHPLIDLGGITQPEVLPHLRDPAEVLRWARRSGARYFILENPPDSQARVVYEARLPYVSWSFKHSLYGTSTNYSVYEVQPR